MSSIIKPVTAEQLMFMPLGCKSVGPADTFNGFPEIKAGQVHFRVAGVQA